jgi:hypothetical protein
MKMATVAFILGDVNASCRNCEGHMASGGLKKHVEAKVCESTSRGSTEYTYVVP